jgi:hypothetical protein
LNQDDENRPESKHFSILGANNEIAICMDDGSGDECLDGVAQTASKVDLKQHDQDRLLGQDRDSNRSGQIKRPDGIVAKGTGAEACSCCGSRIY